MSFNKELTNQTKEMNFPQRKKMNPVIIDSNNNPVIIPGYFGKIDHQKKKKILKRQFMKQI